jgi:hypothetical protein
LKPTTAAAPNRSIPTPPIIFSFEVGRWMVGGWSVDGRWMVGGWSVDGRWMVGGWSVDGRWMVG